MGNNRQLEMIVLEHVLRQQLSPLDIDLVAEYGGYSLYDRMLPKGQQMLCNTNSIDELWERIFQLCSLTRNDT